MNKSVEKNRALEAAEELQVVVDARQAAARLDRAVHRGRPHRPGRQGTGGDRGARDLPAAGGQPPKSWTAPSPRRCAETGASRPEGHGQGHEGGHGRPGGQDRRRQEGQRTRQGPTELLNAHHWLRHQRILFNSDGRQTFRRVDRLYLLKGLVSLSPSSFRAPATPGPFVLYGRSSIRPLRDGVPNRAARTVRRVATACYAESLPSRSRRPHVRVPPTP